MSSNLKFSIKEILSSYRMYLYLYLYIQFDRYLRIVYSNTYISLLWGC